MVYAVTHVIVAIVLIDLYRDYIAKKKFSTWFVLIGGIAGLLPDLDLPLQWIVNGIANEAVVIHRVISHSLMFVAGFLLIALFFIVQKHKTLRIFRKEVSFYHIALFFTVIAVGWFTHIALDCSIAGDYNLTWFPGVSLGFCFAPFSKDVMLGLDAIILILWLIHEEWAHKIKDFI
jgi:membrane-bound metal-dependent hydrolase YbcI (DUF457 family)